MNFRQKISSIIAFAVLFFTAFVIIRLLTYSYSQQQNLQARNYCEKHTEYFSDFYLTKTNRSEYFRSDNLSKNKDSCICEMYNLLMPKLLVYKAKHDGKDIPLLRFSWDAYVTPSISLEKADTIISYGIAWDIQYEDRVSKYFNKPVYAYDCGVNSIDNIIKEKNPLLHFKSECIGTDKYILKEKGQISSEKIHTFSEKFEELNLKNKKIYIKMDIAGAESEVLHDILKYSDNITGMSVVIRLDDSERIIKFSDILNEIDKSFVLVARNGVMVESYDNCKCRYAKGEISNAISLAYINKNLTDNVYLPLKQDSSGQKEYISLDGIYPVLPKYSIGWEVVLSEKLSKFFNGK